MPASEARPPSPSPATGRVTARSAPTPIVSADPADLDIPGVIVEVDAETAASMGAFEETALTEADAWEANADIEAEREPGDDE